MVLRIFLQVVFGVRYFLVSGFVYVLYVFFIVQGIFVYVYLLSVDIICCEMGINEKDMFIIDNMFDLII